MISYITTPFWAASGSLATAVKTTVPGDVSSPRLTDASFWNFGVLSFTSRTLIIICKIRKKTCFRIIESWQPRKRVLKFLHSHKTKMETFLTFRINVPELHNSNIQFSPPKAHGNAQNWQIWRNFVKLSEGSGIWRFCRSLVKFVQAKSAWRIWRYCHWAVAKKDLKKHTRALTFSNFKSS